MKNKLILIIIFLLAFCLRFYNYKYPPLLWDEAALGYNAYSILETGRDEYGKIFPLIFKSFGDYKPGIYVYLAIPFIKLFGLNELSVRLPSILLGSLIPILLYFLILKLSKNNYKLAIIAAILTVFNPFNITYSHLAWETNILTFELILAIYLFFDKKYFWSSILFGLTLYTYQAGKMISLFLIIILFFLKFKSNKFLIKKIFLQFILPLSIFTIPLLYGLFFQSNSNRLKVASLFSYPRSEVETNLILNESNKTDYAIFHNKIVFFTRNFFGRYFNHYSPEFLIFKGDWQNPRHGAPYLGVLLFPSIIFLVIGLFEYKKIDLFFLLWFIVAPLTSALTRDSIQSTRSMSFSIPLIYFTASGINIFLKKYKSITIYLLLVTIYILSFVYFCDMYFNHTVKTHPVEYLYGYTESTQYLIENQNKYQNIQMTDFYGQPYIYYLFFAKYPPLQYQKQANLITSSVDTGKIEKIDNINFGPANWPVKPNSLTVFSYDEVVRQNLDFKNFKKFGNFYIYEKP